LKEQQPVAIAPGTDLILSIRLILSNPERNFSRHEESNSPGNFCCARRGISLSSRQRRQGLRQSQNRKRDLPALKAIDTTGAYEVEVMCQKPASFEIEADDNILPLIKRMCALAFSMSPVKRVTTPRGR
jgi:hypothetical protein